jgi:hypothetical protein
MDYNQAMQQIQAMQMYRRMLGLDQAQAGQPQQMQYVGMNQGGGQQQQQQSSNPMSTYNNVMKMMGGGTTATGMTPNATNPAGESFYGWGAQTGDWGATASPAMYDATTMGSTPAATSAFGGGGELAGTSGLAGVGEAGGAGASSYLGYAAPILAAIAGQHMMSSGTDRRTMKGGESGTELGKGHRTGDMFSGDFFTEPWMAWGEQQLGVDTPTAGEKTDAAIDRMREGEGGFSDLASTIPGTAYQWFDPVGNFAGDIMGDKYGDLGKALTMLVLPHTGLKWGADWLGKLF